MMRMPFIIINEIVKPHVDSNHSVMIGAPIRHRKSSAVGITLVSIQLIYRDLFGDILCNLLFT